MPREVGFVLHVGVGGSWADWLWNRAKGELSRRGKLRDIHIWPNLTSVQKEQRIRDRERTIANQVRFTEQVLREMRKELLEMEDLLDKYGDGSPYHERAPCNRVSARLARLTADERLWTVLYWGHAFVMPYSGLYL